MTPTMQRLGIDRLSLEQRQALARRDLDLDKNPAMALTWEQIRASVEAKRTEGRASQQRSF